MGCAPPGSQPHVSSHQSRSVHIPETGQYCTRNRAQRFVAHGRAEWIDANSIRFLAVSAGRPASLAWSPQFAIVPRWQACYRTAEAPVIQPSVEWLNTRLSRIGL